MEKLHEELIASKQEIKNAIAATEVRLLLKIETFSEKIKNLEKENTELKQRIEILDRNNRKNNIVVYGLVKTREEISVENLCNQLNSKLDVGITKADISNSYPLGKANNCPIKIELVSTLTKINILQNCKKLKGTNITISADLTKEQQKSNKILRTYLKQLRETGEGRCYIKGEKLYRNNVGYTAEEILEIESTELPNSPKLSSAPESPSRLNSIRNRTEDKDSQIVVGRAEPNQKVTITSAGNYSTEKRPDIRERKNSVREIITRSQRNAAK